MFGSGLLKGLGITLKHCTDTFADDREKVPSRYQDSVVSWATGGGLSSSRSRKKVC